MVVTGSPQKLVQWEIQTPAGEEWETLIQPTPLSWVCSGPVLMRGMQWSAGRMGPKGQWSLDTETQLGGPRLGKRKWWKRRGTQSCLLRETGLGWGMGPFLAVAMMWEDIIPPPDFYGLATPTTCVQPLTPSFPPARNS